MRVKLKQAGQGVAVFDDVDMLLIEDSAGNIVGAASRYGPGDNFIVDHLEPGKAKEFEETLRQLGLDRTVIVQNVEDLLQDETNLTRR